MNINKVFENSKTQMYPWISRTLDFWLQFFEKKCGLYMDVYGNFGRGEII